MKTPKELVNRLKKLIEQKGAKLIQIEILKSKIAEYEKKNTRMEQFRLENLEICLTKHSDSKILSVRQNSENFNLVIMPNQKSIKNSGRDITKIN